MVAELPGIWISTRSTWYSVYARSETMARVEHSRDVKCCFITLFSKKTENIISSSLCKFYIDIKCRGLMYNG